MPHIAQHGQRDCMAGQMVGMAQEQPVDGCRSWLGAWHDHPAGLDFVQVMHDARGQGWTT